MDTKSKSINRSYGIVRSPALKTLAFLAVCALMVFSAFIFFIEFNESRGMNAATGTIDVGTAVTMTTDSYSEAVSFEVAVLNEDIAGYNASFDTWPVSYVMGHIRNIITSGWLSSTEAAELNSLAYYYINTGEYEYTNTNMYNAGEFMDAGDLYLIYEGRMYASSAEIENYEDYTEYFNQNRIFYNGYPKVYFTIKPEAALALAYFVETPAASPTYYFFSEINYAIISLVCAGILIVYLCFVTGRRPGSEEVHLCSLDRIYSDINLAVMTMLLVQAIFVVQPYIFYADAMYTLEPYWGGIFAIAGVLVAVELGLFLSLVRKIKARKLLRHSLCGVILYGLYKLVRNVFSGISYFISELFSGSRYENGSLQKRMAQRSTVFIIASAVNVAVFTLLVFSTTFLCLVCVAIELVMALFYIRSNNADLRDVQSVCLQVDKMFQGNLKFDPGISRTSPMFTTSAELLDIGEGMNKSVQKQVASERTKIALITNVSHDLKTPLTSIIGYIELLSQEDSLSAEAKDYVNILYSKSKRLKSIIEDLFDLAKTAGGESMNIETLELRRLVEQTLGEMEDRIEVSGQVVKTDFYDGAMYIRGDGRKLYRVMQNILDNALKYSMPGTRIFVSTRQENGVCSAIFKNTSKYEMDFTADEILERFTRGDKSRTSEGSGLGLSIAESFVKACGGDVKIDIDGDQFKMTLTFGLVKEEQPHKEVLGPRIYQELSRSADLVTVIEDFAEGKQLLEDSGDELPEEITAEMQEKLPETAEEPAAEIAEIPTLQEQRENIPPQLGAEAEYIQTPAMAEPLPYHAPEPVNMPRRLAENKEKKSITTLKQRIDNAKQQKKRAKKESARLEAFANMDKALLAAEELFSSVKLETEDEDIGDYVSVADYSGDGGRNSAEE